MLVTIFDIRSNRYTPIQNTRVLVRGQLMSTFCVRIFKNISTYVH